jgi:HSP20 family protein
MRDNLAPLAVFFGAAMDRCGELRWRPAADIYRTQTGWLVKYDLAGVTTKDVEIAISGSTVTLRGCRRDGQPENGCTHYAMEISYSRFERAIELPCELDRAQLKIQWRDGILLLRLFCEGEPL